MNDEKDESLNITPLPLRITENLRDILSSIAHNFVVSGGFVVDYPQRCGNVAAYNLRCLFLEYDAQSVVYYYHLHFINYRVTRNYYKAGF